MLVFRTRIDIVDDRTDEDILKESSELLSDIKEYLESINPEYEFESDIIDYVRQNRVHRLDAEDHIKEIKKTLRTFDSTDSDSYTTQQLCGYMLKYSKEYPNTLFKITHTDSKDIAENWCIYFKGGKSQECKVSWSYENYDESKLQ